jgi:Rho-binding antiterminator
MNRRYTPIPCEIYSRYELAVLHRAWLRVLWHGRLGPRLERLLPVDLRTHRGAEYLIARTPSGVPRVMRLDRIRSAEPVSGLD